MKQALNLILSAVLLLGLPLAGMVLSGHNAMEYLEFPPRTQTVDHATFSWPVFIVLLIVIVATALPFIIQVFKNHISYSKERAVCSFPWWGWAGAAFGAVAWVLAWTRFSWFASLQHHTFTLPWIAYIIVVNALTFRRTGHCLLTHRTKYFLWLFPVSAGFWWFFEYLNRFVQNWYYTACDSLSGMQYFVAATLPFATVLPAVLSTEEWLETYSRMTAGLESFLPIRFKHPRQAAGITLMISAAGLFFIGWFPDQLFPLLWIAPLLLLVRFQILESGCVGEPVPPSCLGSRRLARSLRFQGLEKIQTLFSPLESGDWRRVFRLCLAALICGIFWEMWNMYSLSRWIYTVPYVNRFHLFEMPILGYSGYLPFGLECAIVADIFLTRHKPVKSRQIHPRNDNNRPFACRLLNFYNRWKIKKPLRKGAAFVREEGARTPAAG